MAATTLDRITSFYTDLIPDSPGFRLDKKMSKYWTNAIDKGEKSYDDFTDFVVQSTDYANHARRNFVDVYYELSSCFPEDADVHKMFDDMMATTERKAISRLDMRKFIVRTDMFAQGCATQVDRLQLALTGKPADVSIRQAYLTRFMNDPTGTYSIDRMQEDISKDPNDEPQIEPARIMPPSVEAAAYDQDSYVDVVNVYEDVMGRPMGAREFLLFSKELHGANTNGERKRKAVSIKDNLTTTFLKVKDLVHKYLDEDLTENVFIRNHLSRSLTLVPYEDHLKTEIVMGDVYPQKMKQKISELHQQMYGDIIGQADCDFLFERFRVLKMELVNEDMNQMIGQFRKETDDIVQTVYDIYMQVYEREPDEEELASHVSFIRVGENAIAMIKSQLRGALEYHDVLKRKIKKVHATVRPDPILPSHIFKILNKVLAHKDSDDIESVIQSFV